ncbi:hypothetical protein LSUE1_G010219, partial [Lachnellula suecica]
TALASSYTPETRANVTLTIYEWLADIAAVNYFVDHAPSSSDPSALARAAFPAAQNEATSNTILSERVKLDAKGEAASLALPAGFAIIGPAINDTIYHPENVRKNVAAVNGQRCPPPTGQGGISKEGDVQQAAATAIGIVVPTPATPTACFATATPA